LPVRICLLTPRGPPSVRLAAGQPSVPMLSSPRAWPFGTKIKTSGPRHVRSDLPANARHRPVWPSASPSNSRGLCATSVPPR
jgi:hypothetical protein